MTQAQFAIWERRHSKHSKYPLRLLIFKEIFQQDCSNFKNHIQDKKSEALVQLRITVVKTFFFLNFTYFDAALRCERTRLMS